MIEIAIIIVNYNLAEEVKSLLESIFKFVKVNNFKVFVVDNNSSDRSIENLKEKFPLAEFIFLNTNLGFGHANNFIFKNYKAKYYLLLNPDTILVNDVVSDLVRFAKANQDAGIVGATLLNEDGTVQHSARRFPGILSEFMNIFGMGEKGFKLIKKIRHKISNKSHYETDFIYGSCMLIKSEVLEKIGYFDEKFFLFSEETDLCYRLKKYSNFKVYYYRDAKILHSGGKITNQNKSKRIKQNLSSQLLFYEKNYSFIKVLILRILNILIICLRIITVPLFVPRNKIKEYFKDYFYLIKFYLLNHKKIL